MALILNIETATDVCSVAIGKNGVQVALRELPEGQGHSRYLTTLITEALADAGVQLKDLDAISVSKGPGSFTGLRIGVATAKGLCFALDKPLLSVNTLLAMSATLKGRHPELKAELFCPMIDARRMEVYTALIDPDFEFVKDTSADILTADSFREVLDSSKVAFFGDGMMKFRQIAGNQNNAVFIEDFQPSASGMIRFSEKSYNEGKFEIPAYFEPYYLKDFYSPGFQ